MLLRLHRYTFDLVYRPGTEVVLADTLSRAYPPGDPTDAQSEVNEELAALTDDEQMKELRTVASQRTIDAIQAAAAEGDVYQLLVAQIKVGWPPTHAYVAPEIRPYASFGEELVVSGGLIYKGNRVVIPRRARSDILRRIHASHIGVNGCIRRAREAVFFPGMTAPLRTSFQNATYVLDTKPNTGKSH